MGGGGAFNTETLNPDVCYFTREWGDNVDDWYSHNSPSRVNRVWGEVPMLIQAQGYANPDYKYTCYDVLYRTSRQHMGGWDIILIRFMEELWMRSGNRSSLIICSVRNVLRRKTRN